MSKKHNQEWDAARQLTLKLQKAVNNFCEAYLRLEARDRRKVYLLLKALAYLNTGTSPDRNRWTSDDMRTCYQQLRRISQKLADCWRCWASAHLRAGLNHRLSLTVLVDTLVCQMWIEKSSADS